MSLSSKVEKCIHYLRTQSKRLKNWKHSSHLSFSYEAELTLSENPNVLNYYRLPSISEQEWLALPDSQKLKLAEKLQSNLVANEVFLVKLSSSPKFLAPSIIQEYGKRMEMNETSITNDLETIRKELEWITKNIGLTSLQGHVSTPEAAFTKKGVLNFVQLDHDITLLSNLSYGYNAYLKDPSKIPSQTFTHFALGPLDKRSLDRTGESLDSGVLQSSLDPITKYMYSIVYRSDIYGQNRVGFEIRNCHNRPHCLLSKMKVLGEQVQNDFVHFIDFTDMSNFLLNDDTQAPNRTIQMMLDDFSPEIEANFEGRYKRKVHLGRRFLFPLLEWQNHPLILKLDPSRIDKAKASITTATLNYQKTLETLAQQDLSIEDKVIQARITLAKWAHKSNISKHLKYGYAIRARENSLDN